MVRELFTDTAVIQTCIVLLQLACAATPDPKRIDMYNDVISKLEDLKSTTLLHPYTFVFRSGDTQPPPPASAEKHVTPHTHKRKLKSDKSVKTHRKRRVS